MKKVWGCEKSTQAVVWVDEEEGFYNCPLKFIGQAVINWYQEYRYNQKYNTVPSYQQQSARYLAAENFFEYQCGIYESEKQEILKMKNDPLVRLRNVRRIKKHG